jgi:polyisoprenoid-binding protein YceI
MDVIPRTALALATLALAACGGADQPAATVAPTEAVDTASPTATVAATATVSGGITFTVATGSKAIIRVNEQLADRNLPNDAVLTTEKVTGEFTVLPDGTFTAGSKIVADLTALSSDVDIRDDFIKQNTLQTRRFPEATFVPTRAERLELPLLTSGATFKLVGQMTIRGVTKEMTFDVVAKQSGSDLAATAKVTPAFQFGTFGMSQPRVFSVISIRDEIRLEVELVAKQG